MRARRALAGALLLLIGCGWNESRISRALERMKEQPRYDVYEESRFFPDGKVLQTPPAGTVSREHVLASMESPPPVTPALVARGASRFGIFCAVCHGAGGYGGSIVASNMVEQRPPSLHAPPVPQLPPDALYRIIRDGFGRMPSYAAELSVHDRWAVVAYVRDLQQRGAMTREEQLDSVRAAELRVVDSVLMEAAQ